MNKVMCGFGFQLHLHVKWGVRNITRWTELQKAKYFSKSGFLDANLGHSANFTLKSICSSILLISLGYRWHIGTGTQINVWTDLRSNIVSYLICLIHLPIHEGMILSILSLTKMMLMQYFRCPSTPVLILIA